MDKVKITVSRTRKFAWFLTNIHLMKPQYSIKKYLMMMCNLLTLNKFMNTKELASLNEKE